MSLAKRANTVQDIIYEIFESQRDTQGVPQLFNSPMPSAQHNIALRHCSPQKPPG